jgi:glycosyltransferase involved in cell wall biosynthesis
MAGRRILMVTPTIGRAGAEQQLVHLAIGLARRGDEPIIACLLDPRRDVRPLLELGIRVLSLHRHRPASRVLAIPALIRLARGADVVYCAIWDASLWGRLAALLARRPVVVTEHTPGREFEGSGTGAARARWIALHNRLLGRVTYATAACGQWQPPVLEGEGVPRDRIVYIPNGIPYDEVRAASENGPSRGDLGLPDDALVVLHAARFNPLKNQGFTLAAVQRLRASLGDVRVLFAGDGPERPEIERRSAALGADWAAFLGSRDDVPALMRLADLVVLPSLGEGMPITVLEAIAIGTPIVATDVGDLGRVVSATGTGKVVPPGDLDAFTAACRAVLTGPKRRHGGRTVAPRDFDATVMVERYAALFDGAVAGTPPRALRLDH